MYNPNTYWGNNTPGGITLVPFHYYFSYTGEEYWGLGESWSMPDDTTLRQTFRDDVTWWDGTPVDTKDIEVQERFDDVIRDIQTPPEEQEEPPFVKGWNIVDDRTWELNLTAPFSEEFIKSSLTQDRVTIKADLYEPHLEEMEDLLEDDDREGAKKALTEFLKTRFGYDKIYGNGPFKYRDHDDTRLIYEVNDDYHFSDQILFTEYMWKHVGDPKQAFIQGNVDMVEGARWLPSEDERKQAKQNMGRIALVRGDLNEPSGEHYNMAIYDLPEVTAPEGAYEPITKEPEGWLVRKALAYAINNEQWARARKGPTESVDFPISGITYGQVESGGEMIEWARENLENYAPHKPEKAKELLREAGLTFDDQQGKWLYPDWHSQAGDPVEVVCMSPTPPAAVQVTKQNLEDIGLSVTIDATEDFGSKRHQGEFDTLWDNGTVTGNLSIYSSFPVGDWFAKKYNGPAGARENRTWPIPTPIGNTDVTDPGQREEWNMAKKWSEFLVSGNQEKLKELSWMVNQFVTTAEFATVKKPDPINGGRWYVDGPRGLRHAGHGHNNLLNAQEGIIAPNAASDYHPTNS
jgi:ABC-type transport system substrate-binding protein